MTTARYITARQAEIIFGISARSLLRLRNLGILAVGKCWIRKNPLNANSDVLYDVEACRQAFITETSAIEAQEKSNNQNP